MLRCSGRSWHLHFNVQVDILEHMQNQANGHLKSCTCKGIREVEKHTWTCSPEVDILEYTWTVDLLEHALLTSWCEHAQMLKEKLTSSFQCTSWHLEAHARTSKRATEKLCGWRCVGRVDILEGMQTCSWKCRTGETCAWKVDILSCECERTVE